MIQTTTPKAKYTMTISRLTVDKLGVKLYDKVSAVLAELVANCYDADATEVRIIAPMGEYLASKSGSQVQDKGYSIEVIDTGTGMTPAQINDFYLRVGAERRNDPRRGDTSKIFGRKVLGRKGVGKLAPFGICQSIEVLSSGGDLATGKDQDGRDAKGYLTAHFILDRSKILTETDTDYEPEVGPLDGIVRSSKGTEIRLRGFSYRQVPTLDDLERQMARRFGIQSPNWTIRLIDSTKQSTDPNYTRLVGQLDIPTMEGAKISFDHIETAKPGNEPSAYRVVMQDGNVIPDLQAGFGHDGKFYPVTGWVAYAKENYKDDIMAGVRIYCRGKIAAQPSIFNLKSGFTGEYDIRSYLVGELHADWLDEEEDLLSTDRRDILWSSELGQAFEKWGQTVVRKVGTISRNPMKKKSWDYFREVSKIEQKIDEAFPVQDQKDIREKAMDIAKLIGRTMRQDEINDEEQREAIVDLSLTLAPHITLDTKLREAAGEEASPLAVMTEILKTARIAELSSFGRIADDRVRVIDKIEEMKGDVTTIEAAFQFLIQQAPWLIDPQWSPLTANQAFSTLKAEFQKYYKKNTGEQIELDDFAQPDKRVDFVLSSQDNVIQMVEIKPPSHTFNDDDMARLNNYVEQMTNFLNEEGNQEFRQIFNNFHVTLICDKVRLTGVSKTAFEGLKQSGKLTHINWRTFLLRTKRMHEDFLAEAERQKRVAVRRP